MPLGIESLHAATGKSTCCNKDLVQPKTNKQAKNDKKGMVISKLSMNLLIGKYCCKLKTNKTIINYQEIDLVIFMLKQSKNLN